MVRLFAIAIALLLSPPAAGQTGDIAAAMPRLAAIWRPIAPGANAEAVRAACDGAIEELAAVDAQMPAELSPQNLARVRPPRGLIIIPLGEEPSGAYFFAPAELAGFVSGLGAVSVADETQGRLRVRDAAGAEIELQLGALGPTPALRVASAGAEARTFVGCAPTLGP
ncbi:MAG: hypothetical protein ABL883_06945 [Terricaulis sp.]